MGRLLDEVGDPRAPLRKPCDLRRREALPAGSDSTSEHMATRQILWAILMFAVSDCATRARPPSPTSQGAPPGVWRIVGHVHSGYGAISNAEAATWHGRKATFNAELATFGTDSCPNPSYRTRVGRADSLLGGRYRLVPWAGLTIALTEVDCGGIRWGKPGSILIRTDDGRVWAAWAGVFFELRRTD